jgi:hypothetical protein
MTVDSNVTAMINEEWNTTYSNTGVAVDNSSIQLNVFRADINESFTFKTTNGKMYIFTMSIKSSGTPNTHDINDHPVEAYNLTIAPYQLLPTTNGSQEVTPAPLPTALTSPF